MDEDKQGKGNLVEKEGLEKVTARSVDHRLRDPRRAV